MLGMSEDLGRDAQHSFTFFSNHAAVLSVVYEEPDATISHIAIEVGISRRAVQMILRDLEDADYITRERIGRNNRYRLGSNKELRKEPVVDRLDIDDVLGLLKPPRET